MRSSGWGVLADPSPIAGSPPLRRLTFALLASLTAADAAQAAEVVFEGDYRARARWYDTLSLDRDLALSEGAAAYVQHRLWLQPRFLLSDQVQFTVEIRALDNVLWGTRQLPVDLGFPDQPPLFGDELRAPNRGPGDDAPPLDITLWRVWGDIETRFGRFSAGRMPLHWGAGIWQNDGQTVRPHFADFGDSVDRLQWEYLIQDQIFLRLAFDLIDEDFINHEDDTVAYNLVGAWRTEQIVAGLNARLRRNAADDFNLLSIDLAADAELGPFRGTAEFIGQFGGGDLPGGINDVNVTAFGGVARGTLDLDAWEIELEGGFATGDDDPRDLDIRTFTFDRDYSVALVMFEQPLPTLQTPVATSTTGSRTTDFAQTGTAISNALYIRPSLRRDIIDGLQAQLTFIGARAAKVPDLTPNRSAGYGVEFDLGLRYTAIQHLDVLGLVGVFLPGDWYTDSEFPDFEADLDGPVWAAQLSTRLRF